MVMMDAFEYRNHSFSQAQLAWLEQDLARANAANMWTFVVFHTSMYSTSEHGPYPEMAAVMEPIMKNYEIDAMFWGHDHIFEAYHALSNESYGGTYCFMVAGGGGSIKPVADPDEMHGRVWNGTKNEYGNYINYVQGQADGRFDDLAGAQWQLYGEAVHHFMLVEVTDQTATFSAYRSVDGSLIQSYIATNH
jgi:hypothetical protein